MALEERANRFERTGEELIYHDLAEEWYTLTGLPFVSAVWPPRPAAYWTRVLRGFYPIPRPRPREH